jgi:hypothetical protein
MDNLAMYMIDILRKNVNFARFISWSYYYK